MAHHHHHDPLEGIAADGTIVTGAHLDRVPTAFGPILAAAVGSMKRRDDHSLYLYGSVATGTAVPPFSDVDLVAIGLEPWSAAELGRRLSLEFRDLCRAVEVAAGQPEDLDGGDDEAYGNRVFLRHYCAHLAGPDLHSGLPAFPADARAARGLNGDIGRHADRWRSDVSAAGDAAALGRRVARKTLLAVAGLVSVHDGTWTTDRRRAAHRWAEIEPSLAGDLAALLEWSGGGGEPDAAGVRQAVEGVVAEIVRTFDALIGVWPKAGESRRG